MPAPKVSIVSAYYNREEYVTESIQSLLDQSYTDIEIIIVNDGSTDNTLDKLNAIKDDRLKIITQENGGFVSAIRRAVDEASGEYIAVHGSGDISLPTRIEKQAHILETTPNVGVVSCHVEDDCKTGDAQYTLKIANDLNFTKTLMQYNMFTHGEVMFRKSVYQKVGGYRSFFIYAQDRDLWLRMSEHCDYHIVEETLYKRMRLSDGISTNLKKSIIQAYLSDFARYCAKERQDGNPDPLEKTGPQSAFLKPPSLPLSKKLIWLGMNQMLLGNHGDGWPIIQKALHECISKKILFVYAIGLTHKVDFLWNIIGNPVYKTLYKKHLQRSGQA
ncbi:MAG: glycosyltransferase family 2 protein [Alcanivorax sp.]